MTAFLYKALMKNVKVFVGIHLCLRYTSSRRVKRIEKAPLVPFIIFDLAWNGFLLILLAGYVLYLSLKSVGASPAAFSLGVLALLFADADIAEY